MPCLPVEIRQSCHFVGTRWYINIEELLICSHQASVSTNFSHHNQHSYLLVFFLISFSLPGISAHVIEKKKKKRLSITCPKLSLSGTAVHSLAYSCEVWQLGHLNLEVGCVVLRWLCQFWLCSEATSSFSHGSAVWRQKKLLDDWCFVTHMAAPLCVVQDLLWSTLQ